MKKYSLFSLVLASAIAVSCQYEQTEMAELTTPDGDFTITASFETQSSTKTSLSSDGKVLWSAGDAFALLTASSRDKFTLVSGNGTGLAEFKGDISGSGTFYALYPYSEDCCIEDGALKFKLPQTQVITKVGSFDQNSSPSLATITDISVPAQFKNLCGLLELNLCGSSMKVSAIDILDNSGKSVWGDCSVALDGNEGTAQQTMTVTGGSSCIKIKFAKAVNLLANSPKTIHAVVPAGSFSSGFSLRIYDENGNLTSVESTSNNVQVLRSTITSMNKYKTSKNFSEKADTLGRGYYKDVFMNGGVSLTSRTTLPAVTGLLGWTMEYLATGDQTLQDQVIIGDADDSNGVLLYPDGEPRYRMIYVNGGQSNEHGKSLGSVGRSRISTFVKNGGGYVGTCAGALLACQGYDSHGTTSEYLNIWPGHVYHTGMSDIRTNHTIVSGSALLKYYNFGGDMRVDSVYHNGGCYMSESTYAPPAGTEILMRYKNANSKSEGKVSCWAYKPSSKEGRRVLIGSHPEGETSGERRDLFAAMCRYSTDGNGPAQAKGTLAKGVEREMNRTLAAYSPIGDGQYHFFLLNVPTGAKNIKIELKSEYDGNLYLSLRKAGSAWISDADYIMVQSGANKTFNFETLPEGHWSLAVYCPDKPTAVASGEYYVYSGKIEALNGVEYSIKADWDI